MEKIKVSEIFGPRGYWVYNRTAEGLVPEFIERWGVTQGEGKFVGKPSVFLRSFGCNFQCPSFGLPKGKETDEPTKFAQDVDKYKNLSEVPAAQYGCDSFFAWHPGFRSMAPVLEVDEIARQILVSVGGTFFKSLTDPTHLIFTGGEPLLGWQKAYANLVEQIKLQDPVWSQHPDEKLPVTFETNGTQKLLVSKKDGGTFLEPLLNVANITWSVSPKLSVSGHIREEAIHPDILLDYLNLSRDMYLKFVVQDIDDFEELDEVVETYRSEGVDVPIYVMAEGGTPGEYRKHSTVQLVGEAVKRGYNISPRLQVMVGENLTGW